MPRFRTLCWSLLLACLLSAPGAAIAQTILDGYIYDEATGDPLPGANVTIAGSLRGDATDENGYFRIAPLPLGTHELIVSFVGFEPRTQLIRATQPGASTVELSLTPRVVQEGEIEVTAEVPKRRRRHLATFERFFLGTSSFAGQSTIVNPEVLSFNVDDDRDVLVATAAQPLVVENRALGYRVRFLLDEFRLVSGGRSRSIRYRGKSDFTELEPADAREEEAWARNRLVAYQGSLRHFLSALIADKLWDEGFMLVREHMDFGRSYSGVPGGRPGRRVESVEAADVLEPGELPFEHRLTFDGNLKVIYGREVPNSAYMRYIEYTSRGLRSQHYQQESWIALNQPSIVITTDGHVADTYAVTRFGYWYFERVAEMLPREYRPPQAVYEPTMPVAEIQPVVDAAAETTAGLEAMDAGDPATATERLLRVFRSDPAHADPERGPTAYWLGRLLVEQDEIARAHQVWREGLDALGQAGRFDARLADTYVRSVFQTERRDEYEPAVAAYLRLLQRPRTALGADGRDRLDRHLAQMVFLLADEEQALLLEEPMLPNRQRFVWHDDAGVHAATWWRRLDPLPGTTHNERLAEHLRRVAQAETRYTDTSPLGFDARGEVFARYGPPTSQSIVRPDLNRAIQVIRENNVHMPGPMTPTPNEFWAYRDIDENLYYLFILRNGRYREAESPEALIPDDLQRAHQRIGRQPRGAAGVTQNPDVVYATALMLARREVYTELAMMHPRFEEQVEELDMFESDMRATMHSAASEFNNSNPGTGTIAMSTSMMTGMGARFKNQALEDRQARERDAPEQTSRVLRDVERLPVALRTARFLNDDGTTRTEIYWSHLPGTLQLTAAERQQHLGDARGLPDRYVVAFTANLQQADYRSDEADQLTYIAADLPRGTEAPIQTYTLDTDEPLFHLRMQWDQHLPATNPETGAPMAGTFLRVGVQEIDSLRALRADPAALEMSDLKPMYLADLASLDIDAPDGGGNPVYPFTTVSPETELGLGFEVYHLAYGDGDQAQYTVEYEVLRDRGRRSPERISAQTAYTSTSRNTQEYIALDLSDYDEGGPLDIIVRITDDVTGQQVERRIRFALVVP